MDEQTQQKLSEIEDRLAYVVDGLASHYDSDVYFLLQLVHSQESDIDATNKYVAELVTDRDNLHERIVSLDTEIDRLRNVTLESLLADPTGINMSVKGVDGLNFMATLIKFFEDNGGENYVTMTFEKDAHKYEITITNLHGKSSVAEKIDELQTQLATFGGIREPVQWFASEMEKTLQANDDKGGWDDCGKRWLLERCADEVVELRRELTKSRYEQSELECIIREATDVANFAMMIADIARRELEE